MDYVLEFDEFVRSIKQNMDTKFSMFLGAGASVESGIPSAGECIWEWKRDIFISKNPVLAETHNNIKSEQVKRSMSVVSAHVSVCPNHQTLRTTPLETRFQVAAFGICGYECNFCDMKKEELEAAKTQIALYKKWREVLQTGTFYRGRTFTDSIYGTESVLQQSEGNFMEWTCVSQDRKKAVGFLLQKLVTPNTQFAYYKAKGLAPDILYHFYNRSLQYNVKEFGDLVNTVAPVHIRQDSLLHNVVAKFVKMDGEEEDYLVYGDTLMYGGIKLKQSFGGTGYDKKMRFFPDFASRMYFMEAE